MKRDLITCPETGYLEVIEYERTPLGTLIESCSRLERCGVDCARVCAARIDRRSETLDCIVAARIDQPPGEHA